MTVREKYLKFAGKCIELQKRATTPDERLALLEMCQTWRELARTSEQVARLVEEAKEGGLIPPRSKMS